MQFNSMSLSGQKKSQIGCSPIGNERNTEQRDITEL